MTRPLTLEEKKFIEKKAKKGSTSSEIAEELGISKWTVYKWRQRLKKNSHW